MVLLLNTSNSRGIHDFGHVPSPENTSEEVGLSLYNYGCCNHPFDKGQDTFKTEFESASPTVKQVFYQLNYIC